MGPYIDPFSLITSLNNVLYKSIQQVFTNRLHNS